MKFFADSFHKGITNLNQESLSPALEQALLSSGLLSDTERAQARAEKVAGRRGTEVWKVSAGSKMLRVKLAVQSEDGVEPRNAHLQREYDVLSTVPYYAELFAPFIGAVDIQARPTTYLVTNWIEGTSGVDALKANQTQPISGDTLLCETVALYRCLAVLHNAGWAHADVQPIHFLKPTSSEMLLLDLGLAQSPSHPLDGYLGGLVHYNAPEVCRAVLEKGTPTATTRSDVFSLASVIFFCLTNTVLGNYSLDAEWEEMLERIASYDLRLNQLAAAMGANQKVLDVLTACLAQNPEERPSSAEEVLTRLAA